MIGSMALIAVLGKVASMGMDIEMLGNACKDPLVVASSFFQLQDILHPIWIDQHRSLFPALAAAYVHRGLAAILGIVFQDIAYLEHRDLIASQACCFEKVEQVRPILRLEVTIMRFRPPAPFDSAAQAFG